MSYKHNPEFTMLELYQAYTDYHGMMDIVERMLVHIVQTVLGTTVVQFKDYEIDFGAKWQQITVRDAIRQYLEIDYEDYPTTGELEAAMRKDGIEVQSGLNRGKLIEHLLEQVEPRFIQPTFVTDYPIDISPFAKQTDYDPNHVERYELYIGGMEIGNAFTELNNPLEQEQRFLDMAKLYRADDDDAAPIDEDYLNAMRYGMPPCGGVGIVIDRIILFLTNRSTIREVVLFPHLRARD